MTSGQFREKNCKIWGRSDRLLLKNLGKINAKIHLFFEFIWAME